MKFTIETLNDNGSGMSYRTKEEFLKEISLQIDDCIINGGTYFDVQVDSDVSCFYNEKDEELLINENEEYEKRRKQRWEKVETRKEKCGYCERNRVTKSGAQADFCLLKNEVANAFCAISCPIFGDEEEE